MTRHHLAADGVAMVPTVAPRRDFCGVMADRGLRPIATFGGRSATKARNISRLSGRVFEFPKQGVPNGRPGCVFLTNSLQWLEHVDGIYTMATQSSARLFFDRAIAGGANFLRELIAQKTPETEWLDFKCGDHLDDNQIRITWSKALCGFANNQGGVLVWGIDARFDNVTKVDAACDLKLVPNPAGLRDRLRQLHPTSTEPPLIGVESTTIFDNGTDGPGFVVSFIPESNVKPHRAELMEGKPYMLRIGDSFKNPSPSILRNLFFPRSSARLNVAVEPEWEPIEASPHSANLPVDIEIRYRITLHNSGLVSAKDIFIIVETVPMSLPIETPYRSTKTETEFGTGIDYQRPLHPSSNGLLCTVRHRVGLSTRTSLPKSTYVPRLTEFTASFQIFAADMTPIKLHAIVTDRELDNRRKKWAVPMQDSNAAESW